MRRGGLDLSTGPRDGTAIVIVVGATLVLSAMGLALVLLSMTETLAVDNERRAAAALHAAEAGLERALPDLLRAPEWDAVLDGRVCSGFTDGAPGGERQLADGSRLSLDAIVGLANCGSAAGCTDAAMNAVTAERPWGVNNPRWRLFAYGPLSAMFAGPQALPPPEYVVVLVADDPAEADDNPLRDGRPGAGLGSGVVQLRAEAFGPSSAHRVLEITVGRGVPGAPGTGYAAQHGQGRTAAGATSGSVQVPGGTLTRSEMTLGGGLTRQ
jgi:hypothetical protein